MARNSKSSKGSAKQSEAEQSATSEAHESAEEEKEATDVEGNTAESSVEPNAESDTAADDGAPSPVADETESGTGGDGTTEQTEELPDGDGDSHEDAAEENSVPGVIPAHVQASPQLAAATSPAPVPQGSTGSGTFGMIFGGLIAGAIGFLVATFAVPEGWPNARETPSTEPDPAIAEQSGRIDALEAELAALAEVPAGVADQAEPVDLGPLTDQVASVEISLTEALTSLDGRLEDLETRLAAMEVRPEASVPDGSAAMEAQMEAFREQLDEVTAEAETRIAEAQERAGEIETAATEAAARAERSAALSELKAALENGTAYSDTLSAFTAVPEPLRISADEGVPTLSTLQDRFPAAARAALATAQTVPEDASAGQRFTAFLRRQTNARSLEPRDGDDPDAILSRAEAALSDGDLDAALDELSVLPNETRDAMSDWISAAATRAEALRAAEALETSMN